MTDSEDKPAPFHQASDGKSPLEGLKVIEMARILAGPWASQVLADLGAEVIKIESSDGDDTRQWGPPFVENPDGSRDAAYFHGANRSKATEVVDLKSEAGQQRVRDLTADADVLIENFKVGGLAQYGLDYASLSAVNERLIYCSITGFGQDGPWAQRPGYDFMIQGLSGIMSLTGEPDGPPQKIGVAYADILTGLYSVIGIQAALAERARTGLGQHIDMSLLDVMVGTLANQAMNFLSSGKVPHRMGNAHPNIAAYEVFPVRDGWFVLAVGNDAQFARFCNVMGIDPEKGWETNSGRLEDRERLSATISEATAKWERQELLAALEQANVPAGPINNVAQALENPQVQFREMQITSKSEDGREVPGLRCPIRFSRSTLRPSKPAPILPR